MAWLSSQSLLEAELDVPVDTNAAELHERAARFIVLLVDAGQRKVRDLMIS